MCRIKYKDCENSLEYINGKIIYEIRVLVLQRKLTKHFWWKFKKRFANTYKCLNHDNNKFILFMRNGVYWYGYSKDREKLNEILSTKKEDFCSHLNMEDITDADYTQWKSVWKDFEIKNRSIPRFLWSE